MSTTVIGTKRNLYGKGYNLSKSVYESLSEERKKLQGEGKLPDWYTTGGWQMFKANYLYDADNYYVQIRRIADHMASFANSFMNKDHKYYNRITKNYGDNWSDCFYSLMVKGYLAPSTPVLANGGTDRGSPVSCSGAYIGDSIDGWYKTAHETALLTKEGFGTSAYLGDIRPRGSEISKGGKAAGSLPCLIKYTNDAKIVSQAGVRRGSWAGYLDIDHDDFDEWADHLHKNPQGLNVGWNISKKFIQRCQDGDEDSIRRYQKALWIKMQTGKGYFWKVDHVNDQQPECYRANNLSNKGSNLCTEIVLHSDEDHSYSCVLSSQNLSYFDDWKETGATFISLVFLDCVAQSFITRCGGIEGLKKVIRYTEKARSLGLGALGLHSYFQKNMIPFDSFEAHQKNTQIFKHIDEESLEASKWMAQEWGEPEWCKGFGIRNTHRNAVAPNMSSAVMAGQVSQGIEPILANVFIQPTASGEMQRINPQFLSIATEKGKYNKKMIQSIIDNNGSVQHLSWLSELEKEVFKTAFEIDQRAILRMASVRQKYIDQGQSLNLFFDADESEEYIAQIHKEALLDDNIKGLYYIRTLAGVSAAKDSCAACEG